ncbi:glycine-rich domain-containing protein [Mycobacterium marinum]|uniref:glycine-rich domain-containing protein n=1 Tax=Mycobacterium marinum TaxID=1781 RepID=UPI000B96FC58|nr:hypothetical protein [Mycobacterium marinum]
MSNPGIRAIRIVKGDTTLHVHGQQEGLEGVWLAAGMVDNIYDAPVKTTSKSGAFQEGSTPRNRKFLHRDMMLGFHVKDTVNYSYELNDSVLRQVFEYKEDEWDPDPQPTTIEVETELSGVRRIDVLMYEEPQFIPDTDPLKQQFGNIVYKLRAHDPMWYSDTQVDQFSAETSSGSGFVTVENPTDNIMRHKWIFTPAVWSIPDVQWVGAKGERQPGGTNGTRRLNGINITQANGGAVGDLDRNELMWRDANDTNIQAQLGATKILVYPIPPYTPARELAVSFTGAPAGGAMVTVRMPQRWTRPWGMELATEATYPQGVETVIAPAGAYSYQMPSWATHVDVILLAGGGGGGGGAAINLGGLGGHWQTATLERGVDIPWSTTTITGVIGSGGSAGSGGGVGGNGGVTTATATGMTPLSATGGVASGSQTIVGQGSYPQTTNFNGRTYRGGGQTGIGTAGVAPGGGGSGGYPFLPGQWGARGQAWFYAYYDEGSGS